MPFVIAVLISFLSIFSTESSAIDLKTIEKLIKEKKGDTKTTAEYPVVLGLKLSSLTPETYHKFKLKETVKGIVVLDVDFDSPCSQFGLRPGDVIVEVSQKEVSKPEEFAAFIDAAKKSNRKHVLLLASRDEDLFFVPMRLEGENLKKSEKSEHKTGKPCGD